jgi:emp24/gp25L/p24 family/GOLD
VISQKSGATGRFTFTAAESGEHRLCFQTSSGGGWFTASHVKLHLDLAVGETGDIDRETKGKTETLAQRVQDLNARLHDIRREQVFQRVNSPSPSPAQQQLSIDSFHCTISVFRVLQFGWRLILGTRGGIP